MLPVEPWSSTEGDAFGPYVLDKLGYKQAMPIDRVLPYSYYLARQSPGGQVIEWGNLRGAAGFSTNLIDSQARAIAQNEALDKIREEMSQASDLVVAWLQRKDAIGQIESGLKTILRTVRAVKRRDPRIVRAVIGRNPDSEALIKTPGGLWLGYWFGIVPTVADIHHAASVFSTPFPTQSLSTTSGFDFQVGEPKPAYFETSYGKSVFMQVTGKVKLSCQISAINHNIALLDRLGFTSPLNVALELVPWSWAINYFINVQQLASNFEPDFPGIEVSMKSQTNFYEWMGAERFHAYGEYLFNNEISGIQFDRYAQWPQYEATSMFLEALSWKRISYLATAITMGLKGFK